MSDQPWHGLSPEIAAVLRPRLPRLAEEIIAAVRTVPPYARPLEGRFGAGIRLGVEQALRHFLDEIESGGRVERPDVYAALGRGEMRAGRSLDALLSAYRVGARVAWRGFAAAGEEAGLDPHTLYGLAEALFAYIDVLSAESAAGFAGEQTAVAGERERRRRRLVRLLLADPATLDRDGVEAAALDAGWPLPRALAALAVAPPLPPALVRRLPGEILVDPAADPPVLLVPDPDAPGRRSDLEHAVAQLGVRAGLGTTVPWAQAAVSLERARGVLRLPGGEDGGLRAAGELTGELILGGDLALAAEFARERLAPLDGLSDSARERMTSTLRVWLDEQGRLGAVAGRLGVHPQTARYRIARLRERFGAELDDPDGRFWLALALRVRS